MVVLLVLKSKLTDPTCRFMFWAIPMSTVILLVLSLGVFWALDRQPPSTILHGWAAGYDATKKEIVIVREIFRNRYCPGVIYRWIIDGIVLQLPPVLVDPGISRLRATSSGYETVMTAISAPPLALDSFVLRTEVHYACNPLQLLFPLVVEAPPIAISISSLKPISDYFPEALKREDAP